MKIEKCRNVVGLFVMTALAVALSGFAVATTSLVFENTVPVFAVGEHICLAYLTLPSQEVCTGSMSPSDPIKV